VTSITCLLLMLGIFNQGSLSILPLNHIADVIWH